MSSGLMPQDVLRVPGEVTDTTSVVAHSLEAMGYELVDIEYGQRGLLRVYIDAPAGIKLEDCERVSRQLSHLLTVEDIDYDRLEVSSPGLDRPLRKPTDFVRFAGSRITVRLRQAFQGRRNFEGTLTVEEAGRFGLELVSDDPAPVKGRRSPQRATRLPKATAAKPRGETPPALKLVFTLEEVERARLVPIVKF